jgi:hypothetical protein
MKRHILALVAALALLVAAAGGTVLFDGLDSAPTPTHVIADNCSGSGGGC